MICKPFCLVFNSHRFCRITKTKDFKTADFTSLFCVFCGFHFTAKFAFNVYLYGCKLINIIIYKMKSY